MQYSYFTRGFKIHCTWVLLYVIQDKYRVAQVWTDLNMKSPAFWHSLQYNETSYYRDDTKLIQLMEVHTKIQINLSPQPIHHNTLPHHTTPHHTTPHHATVSLPLFSCLINHSTLSQTIPLGDKVYLVNHITRCKQKQGRSWNSPFNEKKNHLRN